MLDLLLKGYHTQWHATGCNKVVTRLLQGCYKVVVALPLPNTHCKMGVGFSTVKKLALSL